MDDPVVPDEFDDLYDRHFARLVTALRLAGAPPVDAEDLAQEAFVRTLLRGSTVQDPTAYAFKTGFRLLARSRRRAQIALRPGRDRTHSAPADEAMLHRSAVDDALAQLTPRQRECVVLRHYLERSTEEVARILHIRPATVRVHLHDARTVLRGRIAPTRPARPTTTPPPRSTWPA